MIILSFKRSSMVLKSLSELSIQTNQLFIIKPFSTHSPKCMTKKEKKETEDLLMPIEREIDKMVEGLYGLNS